MTPMNRSNYNEQDPQTPGREEKIQVPELPQGGGVFDGAWMAPCCGCGWQPQTLSDVCGQGMGI